MKHLKLCLLMAFISLFFSCNSSKKDFDSNFAHVVYFWFKDPSILEDRKAFESSLEEFLSKSKYAKTNFVGTAPKAIRDVVDDSFTYNLIVTFDSEAAQEAYQNEEVHLKFIEDNKHLWERVVVYDALPVE